MPALVLDAESTDATAAIAREAGAEIVVRPWDDFVSARRFAIAHVRTPWAFMLDADERLDPTLRRALGETSPEEHVAFRLRRVTTFCGRVVRACGWSIEEPVRLLCVGRVRLEARPAAGGSASLHEAWIPDGPVGRLSGTLIHESYPTLQSYRDKFARYTSVEAVGVHATPLSLAKQIARAGARFVFQMIAYGAARDGWRGWYVTAASALYPVVVHAKALRKR